MVTNTNSVKQKRLATLKEIEELLQEINQDMDGSLRRVQQPLNVAEVNLLDDGEYNYSVRFALHVMKTTAKEDEAVPSETVERITDLRDALEEKAALPPNDQITR